MSKRERYVRFICGHEGCEERGMYSYSNKGELKRLAEEYGGGKYLCCRHTNPGEVLSCSNLKNQKILMADKSERFPDLPNMYWDDGHGFAFGPGFKAYSNDFPAGTKLVITAEIILPNKEK